MRTFIGSGMASGLAITVCCAAFAVDPSRSNSVAPRSTSEAPNGIAAGEQVPLRVSAVSKMSVRNSVGEKLGQIDDLVIDVETGKISFATLGFGGVLGAGKKLFAVPWKQLQLREDRGKQYFMLNVSLDALKRAPGFDENHWPAAADPDFADQINRRYGAAAPHGSAATH